MQAIRTKWRRCVSALALVALILPAASAAKLDGGNPDVLLLAALYRGDAKAASMALESGASANARNSDGTTALIMSVLHADLETSRKLIEQGADVNARSGMGRTPLIAAASVPGRWETVKLLLDKGADPNIVSTAKPGAVPGLYSGGETALTESAKALDTRTLELLLQRGANPAAADNVGNTALHNAAIHGNRSAVRLLLARNVPLSGKNVMGMTPMIMAGIRNDAAIARMLLDAGADVNGTDGLGSTPLMWASFSEQGDPTLVDMLLRAGANPSVKNKMGESALVWAQRNGETAIVDRLRQSRCNGRSSSPRRCARSARQITGRCSDRPGSNRAAKGQPRVLEEHGVRVVSPPDLAGHGGAYGEIAGDRCERGTDGSRREESQRVHPAVPCRPD